MNMVHSLFLTKILQFIDWTSGLRLVPSHEQTNELVALLVIFTALLAEKNWNNNNHASIIENQDKCTIYISLLHMFFLSKNAPI